MKKLIVLILFLIGLSLQGQTVYVLFQLADLGIGLRSDYHIRNLGLYNSISYGNWGIYKYYDLKNHIKLTAGILIPLKDYNGCKFNFTVGVNYHLLSSAITNDSPLDPRIFNSWSFELGLAVKINHFAICVATDILRWEPEIGIGIKF